MSIVAAFLHSKDIRLQLKATDHRDALEETLSTLRCDSRVHDWEKLRTALIANSQNCNSATNPTRIFLHHARTESVSALTLAVGRSVAGMSVKDRNEKIHLVFVAAIPLAMNNEYLRILGAVSRVCREQASYGELLAASDPAGFLATLEKGCRQ